MKETFIAYISDRPALTFQELSKENTIFVKQSSYRIMYEGGLICKVFDSAKPELLRGYRFDQVIIMNNTHISEELQIILSLATIDRSK